MVAEVLRLHCYLSPLCMHPSYQDLQLKLSPRRQP